MSRQSKKQYIKDYWLKKNQRRCAYCCKLFSDKKLHDTPTLERIIPGKNGGTYCLKNTLMVCYSCNQTRGHSEFFSFIEKLPRKEWLEKKYFVAENHVKNKPAIAGEQND